MTQHVLERRVFKRGYEFCIICINCNVPEAALFFLKWVALFLKQHFFSETAPAFSETVNGFSETVVAFSETAFFLKLRYVFS